MSETAPAVHPADASADAPAVAREIAEPFDELRDLTLMTVARSSARIYRQTFSLWAGWCAKNRANPLDLRPVNVLPFLNSQSVAKSTRLRQLSALRKLAQMAYILTPNDDTRRMVEVLKVMKVPVTSFAVGEFSRERAKRALPPHEADKVLRVWEKPNVLHRRNRALIAVLALSALRRSEAAALRWQDIDFENGVVTVRHGKGDKFREVPLAGEFALDALRAWKNAQKSAYKREFVFCPLRKGNRLGEDKPIAGTDVYRIVKATEAACGITFRPHDLRRTFITEALATGTPLATVQAVAGHTRPETTLRYAQTVSARQARAALKLRYG